ncbi:MAG: TauD/TfdA family dioxygenase [Tumebacillaceae bacterium]
MTQHPVTKFDLPVFEEVECGLFADGGLLPLVITPKRAGLALPEWMNQHQARLEALLQTHGGLLFRGFGVETEQDFDGLVASVCTQLLTYDEPSSPRTKIGDKVYTSTEHPNDQAILLHNEMSYSSSWPLKIWFCAVQIADAGGETPLADVRRVYQRIPADVRAKFEEQGWMLVRNFDHAFGLSMEKVFGSTQRDEVEAYCRRHDMEFEWQANGSLRTRQIRKAVQQHPVTGDPLWFNHMAFYHESSLTPDNREMFREWFGSEGMPFNTFYGDGTPIPDEIVDIVRDAYDQEKVVFPWQRGDVAMLDNMLVAHGRSPFQGSRKTLVAMGEAYSVQGGKR